MCENKYHVIKTSSLWLRDNYNVTSNIFKKCPKICIILLKPLSLCWKIQTKVMENTCISVINGCVIMKLCTELAYDKPISRTKPNSKILADVIDNDVSCWNLSVFVEKQHSNFKGCISGVVCGWNIAKIDRLTNQYMLIPFLKQELHWEKYFFCVLHQPRKLSRNKIRTLAEDSWLLKEDFYCIWFQTLCSRLDLIMVETE